MNFVVYGKMCEYFIASLRRMKTVPKNVLGDIATSACGVTIAQNADLYIPCPTTSFIHHFKSYINKNNEYDFIST